MSYIGSTPTTQSFIAGTDYFNGDGSTTAFTLSRNVVSVNDIEVVVNNVVQQPNTAYNVMGTTITFTSAPSAGTGNIYARYLSTTTQSITPSQNTVSYATWDSDLRNETFAFKNRIINGAMVIDQRNVGASVALTGAPYLLDRWQTQVAASSKLTAQQSSVAPTGFVNSLLYTVVGTASLGATDTYRLIQKIEGYSVADLNWGTANAQSVTLSFWVRSSVTGTYGAAVQNSAGDRAYPFTYSISAANTWEQKSVTIPGDTTGTWLTTNGIGIYLMLGLGVGSTLSGPAGAWAAADYRSVTGATNLLATSGATWYITGVQLEKGFTATSFDYRPYGTELALCQRYYYKWLNDTGGSVYPFAMQAYSASNAYGKLFDLPVTMRATPTCSTSGSFNGLNANGNGTSSFAVTSINSPTKNTISTNDWTGSTGMTAGQALPVLVLNNAFVQASAEL